MQNTMTTKHRNWRAILLDTALFGLVFGLTNIVSYLYVVVAGRSLAPSEFGVFNALLGLITMGGVFASSLQVAVTRAVVADARRASLAPLFRSVWRLALPGTVVLTIAAMPFASRIGANALQILFCGVTLLAMILGSATIGFLVGLGQVRAQADLNFFGTIARLAVGWLLMAAGFGISGALAGYAVNYTLLLVLAYGKSRLASNSPVAARARGSMPLHIRGSTIAIFVVAFAPFTLDQLMVQLLNPAAGGDYAALATIAKLGFFASYPITAIAYPNFLARTDRRSRIVALVASMAMMLVVTASLAALISVFPREITRFFFGDRFLATSVHLGALTVGVACFSVAALGTHAQIAWGGRAGVLPSLIAVLLSLALFVGRGDTLQHIVENQMAVYALQAGLVLAFLSLTVARSAATRVPSPPAESKPAY